MFEMVDESAKAGSVACYPLFSPGSLGTVKYEAGEMERTQQ